MSQENKENDNVFTDNKNVIWSITKPSKSNEPPFPTNSSETGKRVKWIGGKATSEECGTIKVYGTTWDDTPMGGNLFNNQLQLVAAEDGYKDARSYKSWGDVINKETQELTTCKIITKTGLFGGGREKCSDDEIRLNLRDFYFTWKPPNKKATLNKKQLFDYNQPQGALLFHLVPELWKGTDIKNAEASKGSTQGGRKKKRRRKTKRKMKRKSKRKMKRKTKRKTKRRRKRRRR